MHKKIAGVLSGRVTKWVVVVFWIAVMAFAAPVASKLVDVQQNDAISWLPGEAESTKALKQQEQFQSSNTIPAVVVYERAAGLTEADVAKAAADARTFAEFSDLDGEVRGPFPSPDNKALQTLVPLNLGADGWDRAPDFADDIRAIAESDTDIGIHISGPLGMASDSAEAFGGIDTTLLAATLAVVIVLLLLTYRSPVLWIFPLFTAVVALFTSQAVIYFLARDAGLVVNGQSAGILTVLVVGAGTDYALLLVARYREELRRHHDKHEAMAVALHRAGPAIFASAGTVILGMLCLVFADMNSTQGLGPVAAIGVGVALLAMVTLLPALLVVFGRWIFWPKRPAEGSSEPTSVGFWARTGGRIAARPRAVWAVTAAILGVACIGVVQLNANGLSNKEQYTTTVDSVTGEEVLVEHGLADAGSPVAIVTDDSSAQQVAQVAAQTDGIEDAEVMGSQGGTTYIEAQLSDAPDSDAAFGTVERLRTTLSEVTDTALVGGTTAINLDVRAASDRDNLVLIPVILVVVLLILMVLLRSIVAPLLLIATVVLSFGAALGVSALVFRHIFDFGGADTSFPLFVFVFLVALGIDYNIFLMTRVREEALKYGTRRGALIGLGATGGVITSAGLVLAGTFAVLGTLPLVFLAELGFAVAFGVLLDTIVVRSVLVTALNLDIGRHMWWPSALGGKTDTKSDHLHDSERVLVGG
ncbi:MAG: MMPL family transporter [Propionibacteriales bacterium]|nr:MMPL family transporter [Propionibacteriales bacterium]